MATYSSPAAFADLLQKAVTEPGILSSAFSQFHNYSLGNVMLAAVQCGMRGIPFGPMATYPRWKELGRYVRQGEKAIILCQPITSPRQAENAAPAEEGEIIVRFVYRPHWFVLAQTEGRDVPAIAVPGWEKGRALGRLDVTEIPFDHHNGNVLGYARGRDVAISPINPQPFRTLFHELAHVLLGHTTEHTQTDSDMTPRNLREAEAEAVALLCGEALGLPGAEESRGYIQHWYGAGNPIPERSAQRILKVADQIIRAGRPDAAETSDGAGRGVRS